MNAWNIDDEYKVFETWFEKNFKKLAWLCYLAGFQAQAFRERRANDNSDARFPIDEARINELEMWRGNRPGG